MTTSTTTNSLWKCSTAPPSWLQKILGDKCELKLEDVVLQAGRHFSDRVNKEITKPSVTKRQLASAIAWSILSIIRPYVTGDRLYVIDPMDGDVKGLCSEIFGVGVALEFLRRHCNVDGRTIRKIRRTKAKGKAKAKKSAKSKQPKEFDYEGFNVNGGKKILIEAKGTFSNASAHEHRKSIYGKVIAKNLPRDYNQAIGIIASTWTFGEKRLYDIQMCDPETESGDHFQEAVREVIRFYAARFDEAVGIDEGTKLLFAIAEHKDLFAPNKPPAILAKLRPDPRRVLSPIRHNGVMFKHNGVEREFWGRIWSAHKLPIPLVLRVPPALQARQKPESRLAFMGLDKKIFELIRVRGFSELLSYKAEDEGLWHAENEKFAAVFSIDTYGVVRGLIEGDFPLKVELHEEEVVPPPPNT